MVESSTPRPWWATIGRVLIIVATAVAVVVVIAWMIGIRVELDGANLPRLARYDEAAHFAALETDRAAQPVVPVPTTAPAIDRRPEALWHAFRGEARDGTYDHGIRTDWPGDGLPLLWHQPIGGGYASFVAADDRLFTIEQRRDREVVTAYDSATGRELWAHGWETSFQEMMGGDGPRATPTWNDGRLFALGASGELRALDAATGELRWRTNILTDAGATNLQWAMAASPLVVDGLVVVLPGGGNGRSVTAYDAHDRRHRVDSAERCAGLRGADAGGAGRRAADRRGDRGAGRRADGRGRHPALGIPLGHVIRAAQHLYAGGDRRRPAVSLGRLRATAGR